jgi:hypothetical protein
MTSETSEVLKCFGAISLTERGTIRTTSLENNEAEAQGRRSCQRTLIAEPLP